MYRLPTRHLSTLDMFCEKNGIKEYKKHQKYFVKSRIVEVL